MNSSKKLTLHRSLPIEDKLIWIGGNVGLGSSEDECIFIVQVNSLHAYWTIGEVLMRINEFSDAAKVRILFDCEHQVKQVLINTGGVA